MKLLNVGDLGFVMIESSPAIAVSTAAGARTWATDGGDYLLMTVAHRGRSVLTQANWSAELCAGDIVMRDLAGP